MYAIEDICQRVNSLRVHQIRSGKTHRFIDISIVEVNGRFFVRQYKFGKNSWYNAFLKEPKGEMKCGDMVIPMEGRVPQDLAEINASVNWAFWKKYHIIYGLMKLGFNSKKHEASTLELIPTDNECCDNEKITF